MARRSGGNLLFLFELLDAVRATRSLAALPDSVEALIERMADDDAARSFREARAELIGDSLVHDDPRRRGTSLAGGREGGEREVARRALEVAVVEDD